MLDPTALVRPDDDPLDIRKDNIFKAVFTKNTPESTGALSNLVSALIGRNMTVVSILTNEPAIDDVHDRQVRFDISCKAEDGELINVEMSLNPDKDEPVRLEFYTAKLFIGQDIRGKDKSFEDLKQTYQIAIMAKERFFQDTNFFHAFEYYDPKNKVSLNGRTQIITLELHKVDKIVEKPIDEMSVSERWAVYFEYLQDKQKRGKINEILKEEGGIAMASQVLMTISRDEKERARLLSEYKGAVDTQSKVVNAKREERAEVARKALAEGLSLEVVQKITGLDIEAIKKL